MGSSSSAHRSPVSTRQREPKPWGKWANGLKVFTYFLVSSGGGRINFCPYAFNHSICCKCPEIISKADAKINLLSQRTSTGLLAACRREVGLAGMMSLSREGPSVYADSSVLPVPHTLCFLIHIVPHFSALGCRTQQRPQWASSEKQTGLLPPQHPFPSSCFLEQS